MENKVSLTSNGIVECRVIGDQSLESILAMGEEIKALLAERKAARLPLLILDDVRKIGQVPPHGRKAVLQFVKTLEYDRLVILGGGGLIRFGANLILRASGRSKKVKYFTDRNQAIAWLLS